MLSYLEKFNNLSPDLKTKISLPAVMDAISEIGSKFNVSLAAVVMRVMVKEIAWKDLIEFFMFEFGLPEVIASQLAEELKEKVFFPVADYLEINIKSAPSPAVNEKRLDTYLTERKDATAARSAQFFFSPEDEEEVKTLNANIPPAAGGTSGEEALNKKVAVLTDEMNLNFSSEELVNRFKEILKTYLRGVRNKVDARQTLAKDIAAGGLNLDEAVIDKIFNLAEKINSQATVTENRKPPVTNLPDDHQGTMIKSEQLDAILNDKTKNATKSNPRDVNYDFNYMAGAKKIPSMAAPAAVQLPTIEKDALTEPTDVNKFKVDSEYPEPVNLKTETVPGKDYRPSSYRQAESAAGKVKMADVKYMPKLMGPLDELREMDITNFRRLGDDPFARLSTLRGKIKFLEENSYSQRLAGIKAWRQSPVYKIYLTMGQESMEAKAEIKEVVAKRGQAGLDYLSPEEFEAVMELNKSLRF